MSKDTLSTIGGVIIAVTSTFQMSVPPDAPWLCRAILAAIAAGLGVWTGTAAYRPQEPRRG